MIRIGYAYTALYRTSDLIENRVSIISRMRSSVLTVRARQ